MCYTAKESAISFGLLTLFSILLWNRNIGSDRVFSPFIFTIGLIQLAEFFIHKKMYVETMPKFLLLILWLQLITFSWSSLYYLKSFSKNKGLIKVTRTISIIFLIIFIGHLFYLINTNNKYEAVKKTPSSHLEWTCNRGSILNGWDWVYGLGLFIPFFLILHAKNWKDKKVWLLLIGGLLSYIFVKMYVPGRMFASMWCYSATFFAFLAWSVGIFDKKLMC